MAYIPSKYVICPSKKKGNIHTWRTNKRKDNDVEIIISGKDAQEIAAQFRSALKKIKRGRELSYYMTIRK